MGDAATSLRTAKGWGSASVKYRLGCQDFIVPDSPFRQELLECSPVIGLARISRIALRTQIVLATHPDCRETAILPSSLIDNSPLVRESDKKQHTDVAGQFPFQDKSEEK